MQPSEDERVLAALSHASIVVNMVNLAGMIATTLIWTTQRERSRYVHAHALQSLVYQGAVLLIGVFLALAWGVCLVLSLLPAVLRPDLYHITNPPKSFWLALLGLIVPVGFAIGATLYGLYGAYRVYRGWPFRYPLVGRLVRRDLATTATPRATPAPAPDGPAPASAAESPLTSGVYEAPPATPAVEDSSPAPDSAEAPTSRRRGRRPARRTACGSGLHRRLRAHFAQPASQVGSGRRLPARHSGNCSQSYVNEVAACVCCGNVPVIYYRWSHPLERSCP
jgi:uncharacterized Tic20 family protein